jgi:hypothetical protein
LKRPRDREPCTGDLGVRQHVREGLQDEEPLPEPGVRNCQVRLRTDEVAVKEEVDVKSPRPVAFAANSAFRGLDGLQDPQDDHGVKSSFE